MTKQLSPMWRALAGAMVRIQVRGNKKTVSTRSLAETARESTREDRDDGQPAS